ncbi:tRNA (adenosine(37)-N6)-dimethylallyltransferase MiaA [Sporolactobacillus shoreicorticis]|uniref:tRNA dimethylallyltransferase n=1 Tax=Sporolactobacillus shoreicorticis TaxID=1923877 RepID=A0ABW5S6U9_9BACL|nr:tRNA (adenosine(37)-N6)-dimethylallyltransferase MiaA [Sporolactobacillus shoreicorticis]MCO7125641.1 tRNA (adenosine(37)-N6)-dimethylallyltransferase MiaA [Sporolactobacillus shoreicorticis]
MKQTTIVIVGPTAVGKTQLSIMLAKRFHSEIVNGDAFQVYRGMDICTAKITEAEAEGVTHHLIDIREPSEPYTVADYQRDARQTLETLSSEGKIPILVGGTGFYIKAALYDYRFASSGANPKYRRKLMRIAQEEGGDALFARLKHVDPIAAERIHPNNVVRVIRALEVYHETGTPFSDRVRNETVRQLYPYLCIGLTMERELLYTRINARVDQMMDGGLLEEARSIYNQGLRNAQAMQAIGYKEFIPFFDGTCPLEEAVSQLKKNSRHYAKRQLTWFRRQMSIQWFDMTDVLDDFSTKAEEIYCFIKKHQSKSK